LCTAFPVGAFDTKVIEAGVAVAVPITAESTFRVAVHAATLAVQVLEWPAVNQTVVVGRIPRAGRTVPLPAPMLVSHFVREVRLGIPIHTEAPDKPMEEPSLHRASLTIVNFRAQQMYIAR
jgi:hypothetical protein